MPYWIGCINKVWCINYIALAIDPFLGWTAVVLSWVGQQACCCVGCCIVRKELQQPHLAGRVLLRLVLRARAAVCWSCVLAADLCYMASFHGKMFRREIQYKYVAGNIHNTLTPSSNNHSNIDNVVDNGCKHQLLLLSICSGPCPIFLLALSSYRHLTSNIQSLTFNITHYI